MTLKKVNEHQVDVPDDMTVVEENNFAGAYDHINYKGCEICTFEQNTETVPYTGKFMIMVIETEVSSLDEARVAIDNYHKNVPGIEGAVRLDGVERNKLHPRTFDIPTETERKSVAIGNFIKVGIESKARGGERFWIKVTDLKKDGFDYVGTLDNDLVVYPEIPIGTVLGFNQEHVLGIIKE